MKEQTLGRTQWLRGGAGEESFPFQSKNGRGLLEGELQRRLDRNEKCTGRDKSGLPGYEKIKIRNRHSMEDREERGTLA